MSMTARQDFSEHKLLHAGKDGASLLLLSPAVHMELLHHLRIVNEQESVTLFATTVFT